MDVEKDYLYDYALKKFVQGQECPDLHGLRELIGESRSRNVLIRSVLYVMTYSAAKMQVYDTTKIRIIYEKILDLVKYLKGLTSDDELKEICDQFFEELLEQSQFFSKDSQSDKNHVTQLKEKIVDVIVAYQSKLPPPVMYNIQSLFRINLSGKIDQHNKMAANNEVVDHEDARAASPEVATEAGGGGETEEERVVEDTTHDVKKKKNPFEDLDVVICSAPLPRKSRKNPFKPMSDAMLVHGVKEYGVGKWKIILNHYKFPPYRKAPHLKDRWRTLLETKFIAIENDKIKILNQKLLSTYSSFVKSLSKDSDQSKKTNNKENTEPEKPKERVESTEPEDKDLHEATQLSEKSMDEADEPDTMEETLNNTNTATTQEPVQEDMETAQTIENGEKNKESQAKENGANAQIKENGTNGEVKENEAKTSTREENAAEEAENSRPGNLLQKGKEKMQFKRKRRLWDVSGEVLTWDEDTTASVRKETFTRKHPQKQHRKKVWNEWEVENLVKGIRRYGVGQWAMILDKFKFNNRNSVMLKDKYRNMLKNEELPRDLSRNAVETIL